MTTSPGCGPRPTSCRSRREHIALRRVGRRYVGLCPFHAEKTPSFSVNAEAGCTTASGARRRVTPSRSSARSSTSTSSEAVERLAGRAGITLRYDDEATSTRIANAERGLVEAMARPSTGTTSDCSTAPDAGGGARLPPVARLDGEVVRSLPARLGARRLGRAGPRARGCPTTCCATPASGFVNRRNRQQDAFRGRVMFPIFDADGDPVAFGGRSLPGAEGPKYKNSPETPIYSKSRSAVRAQLGEGRRRAAPARSSCARATPT